MNAFLEDVGRRDMNVKARGTYIMAMCVSPAAEKVILEQLTKKTWPEVDLVPELRIHGIPVKVFERMPAGQVWWVIKGGKK